MIMHKSDRRNKKWVGLFLVLVLSIFIIGINNDVYADNKVKIKKCPGASSASASINTKYLEDNNVKNITIDLGPGKYSVYLVSHDALPADFKKKERDEKITLIDNALAVDLKKELATGVEGDYKVTQNQLNKFRRRTKDSSFWLIVLLESDSEKEDCDKWSFAKVFNFDITDDTGENYGPIKLTDDNAKVCEQAVKLYNEVGDDKMKALIKKGLSPCFTDSKYNFSNNFFAEIYTQLESFWKDYKTYLDAKNEGKILDKLPDLPTTVDGYSWKEVKNTTLDNATYNALGSKSNKMLTCETKNEKSYQYLYYIDEQLKTVDVKLGDVVSHDKKVNVCKTTCREELITTYGPPKAVIAGQCFTYEVEVKSTVRCVASDINFDDFPDINDYIPCDYRAVCRKQNGDIIDKYHDQAGPTEDFDQCINACDGASYSQECIDSCYNKVYKNNKSNNTTKKNKVANDILEKSDNKDLITNNLNNLASYRTNALSITKMAQSMCPSTVATPENIVAIYNYVNNNVTGYFEKSGNTVKYTAKPGCYWNNYAPYYFNTLAYTAKTVCNDKNNQKAWVRGKTTCESTSACTSGGDSCYPGILGGTYGPALGFKKNSSCNEICSWVPDTSGLGGACYYTSAEQGESDYKLNVKNYTNALSSCLKTATVECKTDSSTYVMSVNKDTKGTISTQICDGDNYNSNGECITFNESNSSITGKKNYFDNRDLHANSIVEYNAGTCSGKSDPDMYHTILTFPGAWINNKNGEVVYKKPDEEKWYTGHPGNYCTPLTGKNVNAHWWSWYQYYKSGQITKSFEEWSGNKELVYNIFSKVQNFGHYNWNFDLGCFFAINDNGGVPDICIGEDCDGTSGTVPDPNKCTSKKCEPDVPKNDPACTGNSCTDTTSDNFVSKSITTKNMFPKTKTSSLATEKINPSRLSYTEKKDTTPTKMADNTNSRTEGFNWSANATNLSIEGYPVTPSSLVKKIESTNPYSDSELDYDITLTKNQINSIKSASKNDNFSYTSYQDGEYKQINNSYKSKYLTVKNSDGTNKYSSANIPDFSYYKSKYLRNKVTVNKAPSGNGLKCNNLSSSNSCDLLAEYTSADSELSAFINSAQNLK